MSATSGSFTSGVFENLWLKILALLLAVGFFTFIHSQQDAQRTVAVKLVVEKPPDDVKARLLTNIPPSVDVTLIGPLQQLEALSAEGLSITLNLTAAQDSVVALSADMITELPPRVKVDRMYPNRLEIDFEAIIERNLRVQVARTGEPAAGTEVVGRITVEPEFVAAVGIESAVSTMQFARAAAFDVTGLGEGKHEAKLALEKPPEGVKLEREIVVASLEISRKRKPRTFTDVAVEVINLPQAATRPATVQVTVQGPPDEVDALRREALVPRVEPVEYGADLSQPGSIHVPVLLDLEGLEVDIDPPKVIVKW